MIARDKLKNFHIIMVALICVGLMPAQADCASVRAAMQISAVTVPSVMMKALMMDDDKVLGDSLVDKQKKLILSLLKQLALPKNAVFTLFFAGEFSDRFDLRVRKHRVQVLGGSEALPDYAVVTLLLNY